MQAQRADNEEVFHVFSQLVGARGANAAQRARNLQIAPVPGQADQAKAASTQSTLALPTARHTGSPGADLAGASISELKPAPRRSRRKFALIAAATLIAFGGTGLFGYHYVTVGRYWVSTDDAYVRANTTTLAAKIAGYVSAIEVGDNSLVHAGDVIAHIDNGDYQLAADAARDKVTTQRATIGRIGEQIAAAQASVVQARAQLASARAVETRTQSELKRQQVLADRAFASQQTLERAQSNRDQAVAAVQSAQAAVASAIANIGVLEAQQQEAERTLNELKIAEAKAKRDLSFAVIRAPVDGVIGNRAMQVGDYVQPGQRLASLVPLADVYIDANFKETQVAHLRPGQPVEVSVDALPGRDITGMVASMAPASGSVFSLLPPDNATGNFTKIVQRLAVRIHLPAWVTDQRLLRPGMSVVVSVNTKSDAASATSGAWFTPATAQAASLKSVRW